MFASNGESAPPCGTPRPPGVTQPRSRFAQRQGANRHSAGDRKTPPANPLQVGQRVSRAVNHRTRQHHRCPEVRFQPRLTRRPAVFADAATRRLPHRRRIWSNRRGWMQPLRAPRQRAAHCRLAALKRSRRRIARQCRFTLKHTGFQPLRNQFQHRQLIDALTHQTQQHPLIKAIEVGGNVGINHPSQPLIGIALHPRNGIRNADIRTTTVGTIQKTWIEQRIEHLLNGALRHPITNGENGDRAFAAARLGDGNPLCGQRSIRSMLQLVRQLRHLAHPVRLEITQRHCIQSCAAPATRHVDITPHPPPRQGKVFDTANLWHERRSLVAWKKRHSSPPYT
jgi:hypothetical protein